MPNAKKTMLAVIPGFYAWRILRLVEFFVWIKGFFGCLVVPKPFQGLCKRVCQLCGYQNRYAKFHCLSSYLVFIIKHSHIFFQRRGAWHVDYKVYLALIQKVGYVGLSFRLTYLVNYLNVPYPFVREEFRGMLRRQYFVSQTF